MSEWMQIQVDPPVDDGDYLVVWKSKVDGRWSGMIDTFENGEWMSKQTNWPPHLYWCEIPEFPYGPVIF